MKKEDSEVKQEDDILKDAGKSLMTETENERDDVNSDADTQTDSDAMSTATTQQNNNNLMQGVFMSMEDHVSSTSSKENKDNGESVKANSEERTQSAREVESAMTVLSNNNTRKGVKMGKVAQEAVSFSNFFDNNVELEADTQTNTKPSKLKVDKGESTHIAISKDTSFHPHYAGYNKDWKHFQISGSESEDASALKITAPCVGIAVYNVESGEIQFISQKVSSMGNKGSLLAVIKSVFDLKKMESHIVKITKIPFDNYTYTAELVPDFKGIDCGHEAVEKATTDKSVIDMVNAFYPEVSLSEILEFDPQLKKRHAILQAINSTK